MKRAWIAVLALVPLAAGGAQLIFDEPWWGGDQQAMRLFLAEAYSAAATAFEDPGWRAAALYRTGEFEQAASVLSGQATPEAAFNRGNALVFLGRYEEAVQSYDAALASRPGWNAAEENRAIASARIRRETALGEATEIGADEIVFDDSKAKGGDTVEVTGGEALGDDALRALWLRSVRSEPGDFLRVKFAYQRATQGDPQEAGR